jgi:hypothetical protein
LKIRAEFDTLKQGECKMINRRDFIKLIGMFSVVLTPLNRLISKTSYELQGGSLSKGELFEGFVLLPADAEVPSFVTPAKTKGPKEKNKSSTVYKEFKSVNDLKAHVKKPIYAIDKSKQSADFLGANVVSYFDDEVFGVSLGFIDPTNATSMEEANISLWAQYEYPRPYPLWNAAPTDEDHLGYGLEKVDFLPSPGIQITTPQGFVFCWIEKNVLYMLILDNYPTSTQALSFVASLQSL